MLFKEIKLFSNDLQRQKDFYLNQLQIPLVSESAIQFTIELGSSKLSFEQSNEKYIYHYCFLIPNNQLDHSLLWLKERAQLIPLEDGTYKQGFKSWNAQSIYFYDGNENIVEFIARHDLDNDKKGVFDQSHIINFNEMGMPTNDVSKNNELLEEKTNSKFWKGDRIRFGTNGDLQGLILLPNYEIKKTWFPTNVAMQAAPFECLISTDKGYFNLVYDTQELFIQNI